MIPPVVLLVGLVMALLSGGINGFVKWMEQSLHTEKLIASSAVMPVPTAREAGTERAFMSTDLERVFSKFVTEHQPEPSKKITHAEFVSIIFPAFGLESRTLKTATVEDKIDILERLGLSPAGGYQPDKILTVEEASTVLRKIQDLGIVRGQITGQLGVVFSSAHNNQPVLIDELAAVIQPDATIEAQATSGSPIPIQTENVERLLAQKGLVEYYRPLYTQEVSPTN